MAQPELAADVPVAQSAQPVEVRALVALRVPADLAGGRRGERLVAHRLHAQPPLLADQGLDHRVAAVAVPDLVRVRLLFDQESLRLQVGDDFLAGLERRQAVVRKARHVHPAVGVHPVDDFEGMALADVVVHRVVARRDLERTGSEILLDRRVADDRQLPPDQRQDRGLSDQRLVSIVGGVDRDASVGEHRLRILVVLRHRQASGDVSPTLNRILDVVQRVVVLLPVDLQVGDGGLVVAGTS